MTYVRKGNRVDVQQLKPWQSRDLLAIEADGITIVNVYKPDGARPRALQLLYDFIPPPNCIIGGDFNSYYELWEPGVTTHNDGNGIANWAESNGLAFIGQIGVPTSRAGHVIDLTFSDIPFASARVTDDLLVAKDHSAILITVPRQHIPRPPRTTISVPDEKLETFAGLVGLGVTELPYISTNAMPEEIDQHTEHILKALVAALDTAGTKSSSKGHNAPWWTEKCQQALTRLRRAKRNIGSEELWKNCEERREFLGTVRREKLEYWRRVIDAVDSDQDLVMDWGKDNKVTLDPKKGEVIHFSRRCKGPAKTSAPDIVSSKHNYTIKPTDKPAVRWLGVWFDRRLKFSHHIQERVGKANKLVQHLRNLSNTKRGPPANLLRKAIITCVIPVLLYGAEAWYEGPTKAPQHIAHARLGNVATMQAEGINKIDETIRNAIRAILPVWKTTPNNTLYRDTGVPTARVALEDARHRFGLRIQAVHKDHPLAARAQREMWKKRFHNRRPAGALKPPQTRLQRASMLPETFPRPRQALGKRLTAAVSVTNNRNKKEAAKEFQQWQKDLPDTHLVAFSDGSQDERGAVGWGYAIYRDGRKIAQGKGRLGIAEVFDGEAEGARNALKRACQIDAGAQIHICIDNTSVIAGLLGDAPTSSQDAFLEFQEIAQAVAVNVRWAPGHEDIEGNEEADRLAKEGTKMLMGNPSISATYAAAKRKIRETRDRHFRDWWQEALPRHRSYHALDLKTATLKCPRELSLSRGTLHHLLACRSTHGDFQSYHRRFNHKDATKCTCGRIKTPEHLVFCRKVQRLRSQWPQLKKEPQNDREYWTELIRQPERFAAFLEMTRFYEKICPNARTTQTQSRTSESRPRTSQPMETQEQASPS
ncbi:hypothetical protein ACKLNR_015162 [Fusarium oxysporum f. sp. zingiberi]